MLVVPAVVAAFVAALCGNFILAFGLLLVAVCDALAGRRTA
jgi:hypothetical protein